VLIDEYDDFMNEIFSNEKLEDKLENDMQQLYRRFFSVLKNLGEKTVCGGMLCWFITGIMPLCGYHGQVLDGEKIFGITPDDLKCAISMIKSPRPLPNTIQKNLFDHFVGEYDGYRFNGYQQQGVLRSGKIIYSLSQIYLLWENFATLFDDTQESEIIRALLSYPDDVQNKPAHYS
jgi:hypothetical protein